MTQTIGRDLVAHSGGPGTVLHHLGDAAADLEDLLGAACRKMRDPLARTAILVVYGWFGAIKLIDASPANPLVRALLERTLPFVRFETFIVFLGVYEIAIGVLFAIPRLERFAVALIIPHLVMTSGPLLFLPAVAWQGFLLPTMEGQYIIKNVLILATAAGLAAQLRSRSPLRG
ncbi:MAG TPA: hypothetical protein VI356_15675 [Myxococcales bacterium]